MTSRLLRCRECGIYTMKDVCPKCGHPASRPSPPRYSPEDRYGEYRRRSILEEYGENGKLGGVQRKA